MPQPEGPDDVFVRQAEAKLTQSEHNVLMNKWFERGQITGMQELSDELKSKAGHLFAAGNNDDLAKYLRNYAKELFDRGEKEYAAYKKKWNID